MSGDVYRNNPPTPTPWPPSIKSPEVATWKEKGFNVEREKKKGGSASLQSAFLPNFILKIIAFQGSTTQGRVYICSIGPLSNANSTQYCIFFSFFLSFFLQARAGNSCKTKCCFVFQGGTGKSLCKRPASGFLSAGLSEPSEENLMQGSRLKSTDSCQSSFPLKPPALNEFQMSCRRK